MRQKNASRAGLTRCSFSQVSVLLLACRAFSEEPARVEWSFPNLPNWHTLVCDFYLDASFAQRAVWPALRVEQAWANGFDAVAVIDTAGGEPTAFREAKTVGDPLGLLVIPGRAELLADGSSVVQLFDASSSVPDSSSAGFRYLRSAVRVGDTSDPAGFTGMTNIANLVHGVEIVSGGRMDANAYGFAFRSNLTILGNSPLLERGFQLAGPSRAATLVFARDRNLAGIREALSNRRVLVVCGDRMFGSAEYLEPLFQRSIEIVTPSIHFRGKGRVAIQVLNRAPIPFELRLNGRLPELDVPSRLVLPPGKVAVLEGRCLSDRVRGTFQVALPCRVVNLLMEPDRPLRTAIRVIANYEPTP